MWITILLSLLFPFPEILGEIQTVEFEIKVEVTDLRNDGGKVVLSLFDQEQGFPGEADYSIQSFSTVAENGIATFKFRVPKGEYAIAILHDENENDELDTNFMGIPKEGIGVSNNPQSFIGPPKYKNAKFEVKEDLQLTINMRYL